MINNDDKAKALCEPTGYKNEVEERDENISRAALQECWAG
jgi:hypothetical protein